MEKWLNILKKSIPYVIILFFTLLGCNLVFYKGLPIGDDIYYHLPNILDKYNAVLNGHSISGISGNLADGIGYGAGLFYSPLSHLTVVIIGLIIGTFGTSIISAYKITIVASVFLSGVFMYRFAMHFTKEKIIASLLAASCYVLYPYRLFDFFCRGAFAEAFAFIFIPLFLMGLYDIVNMDEVNIISFLEVILGGALLYLSHNLTSVFVFIVGFIYLVMNIHRIIPLFKKKHFIRNTAVSIALLAGLASIPIVSQLQLISSELYNISDRDRMWTSYESVISHLGTEWGSSGFFNESFISKYNISGSSIYTGALIFIISCAVYIVCMKLLADFKALRYWDLLISAIPQIIIVVLVRPQREVYFAILIFLALYVFQYCAKAENEEEHKIYKSSLFYLALGTITVSLIAMEMKELWKNAPELLLNIQFPWRLWSLVQVSLSILVGLFASYYASRKNVTYLLIIFISLLTVTSQHSIEKRLQYENDREAAWIESVDNSYLDNNSALGHNKEYCPQVFFDSNYKTQYGNSLYYQVKNVINGYKTEDYAIKPIFLTGEGVITVNSAFAPKYQMEINAYTDGKVQMPLIYYSGYKITLENKETGEKINLRGENTDGLISFGILKGEYTVKTEYVGTSLYQLAKLCFTFSLIAVVSVLAYEIMKKRRDSYANAR